MCVWEKGGGVNKADTKNIKRHQISKNLVTFSVRIRLYYICSTFLSISAA